MAITPPTMPTATAERAMVGTMPSAIWNRSHQSRRFWRGRSLPGSSVVYCFGTAEGGGASAGLQIFAHELRHLALDQQQLLERRVAQLWRWRRSPRRPSRRSR